MRNSLTSLFILIPLLVHSASAQDLPQLKPAAQVSQGRTESNIGYTIQVNKYSPGFADYSLIVGGALNHAGATAVLENLGHLPGQTAGSFFLDKGVGARESGYVEYFEDNTVFRFENVPVSKPQVRDSTLLVLLDMASAVPGPCSIAVVGDVDAGELSSHLKLLSLMVNSKPRLSITDSTYLWRDSAPACSIFPLEGSDVAKIALSFFSPRTPLREMNTIQPYVVSQYSHILGMVFSERMKRACEAEGIPVGSFETAFHGSAAHPGDDELVLSLFCNPESEKEVMSLAASVLSEIDGFGISVAEYSSARAAMAEELQRESRYVRDNHVLMDRCISSYVFGSDLASAQSVFSATVARVVEPAQETEWFNSYVASLLSPDGNFEIAVSSAESEKLSRNDMLQAFSQGWKMKGRVPAAHAPGSLYAQDMIGELELTDAKIKLLSSKKEPISGGEMWTYSNGMKVIFLRTRGSGDFSITAMFNGGGNPFYADLLLQKARLESLADFKVDVNFFDTRVTLGGTPNLLEPALHAFLRLAAIHDMDIPDYEYWRDCRSLEDRASRLSEDGLFHMLDSLMIVSGGMAVGRRAYTLTDNTPAMAKAFFDEKFSAFNDGYVMITGDLDPSKLKKTLLKILPSFPVANSYRQKKTYDISTVSSTSLFTVDSFPYNYGNGDKGLFMAMTGAESFSVQKYFASLVAGRILEAKLRSRAARNGFAVRAESDYVFAPAGRCVVRIVFSPCDEKGLPLGSRMLNVYDDASLLRSLVKEASQEEITPAEISVAKAEVLAQYSALVERDGALVSYTLDRYSHNKDFISNYRDKLNAVPASTVSELLKKLSSGAGADYIVY